MNMRRSLTAALILLLSTGLAVLPAFPSGAASRGGRTPAAGHAPQAGAPPAGDAVAGQAQADFGKLPLEFEANRGQTDAGVDFITRAGGATVFLTPAEAVFVLSAPGGGGDDASPGGAPSLAAGREERPAPQKLHALRMRVEGGSGSVRAEGLDKLPGVVNYFIGSDPAKWRTDIPTFARVRYRGVYEGIDLVYYGAPGRQLEYDFVLSPGADAAQVALSFEGSDSLRVDAASGDLVIGTPAGEVRQRRPFVYQEDGAGRREVESGYELRGGSVGFRLGAYDSARPLVIDPVIVYSTFLGGSSNDFGRAIAVDAAGNAYVTGSTRSVSFPVVNAAQPSHAGGNTDAFVTKLNAAGTARLYSTYLGGGGEEFASNITVDREGSAYVVGNTDSANFPTAGAFQSAYGGLNDAFLTKLSPAGTTLVYSTYLGGSLTDLGQDVEVDGAGSAYVIGVTDSNGFPTVNPLQATKAGSRDIFVSRFNAAGSALTYSTYLGGSGSETGGAIEVDAAGYIYLTGRTPSANFPTASPIDGTLGGTSDAFVTKLNAAGSALVYSTYLGGGDGDGAEDLAVDSAGGVYVTGLTESTDFPVVNPVQPAHGGGGGDFDAFVTRLNPAGTALVYSTYLGGTNVDRSSAIAVDAAGNAYVSGDTNSPNFPTANAIQGSPGGLEDAFVARLGPGPSLTFSTYLGRAERDTGLGLALDPDGYVYLTGSTESADFPTRNPIQPAPAGGRAAFVTKIGGYVISGRVADAANNGVAGVAVTLSGASSGSVTTDASGNFRFPNLTPGENFTVTPVAAGYTFSPPGFTVNNLNGDQQILFVAAPASTPSPTPTPTPTPTPATFGFGAASFAVDEGAGKFQVIVTRSGDASQAATIEYATSDGTADDRGDYTTAVGRLRFAAGEAAKSFSVFVTDDAHVEGNETVQITLSNPSAGSQVAGAGTALLTVVDNDLAASPANPIDSTAFFVRQHYVDFLNREPDAQGLQFWTQGIESCGADAGCREVHRVNVSAAFFLSIEFQETGFLVGRLYRAAFNRNPRYREFLRDTQEVGRGVVVGQGAWEAQLAANQQQFASDFAARADFLAVYAGLSNEQYVDALNANTAGSLSAAERNAMVAGLDGGAETRAAALRKVADDPDFRARETSPAFVLMQYFGYLRRNPDDPPDADFSGYQFWLGKLEQFGGDFRRAEMVRAFLVSSEYRSRFGQP